MTIARRFALLLTALLLPACASVNRQLDREGALIDSPARDWREVATAQDGDRLRQWRSAFVEGLHAARVSGAGTKIDAEGALLAPDAALPGAALPDGDYACRTIKLGAKNPGAPDFLAYPAFRCRVGAGRGRQSLAKTTGSQRPVGRIFPGDAMRSVFLGTLMLGDEGRAMQYGGDPDRDMAGFVERIGPARWRLIVPRPAFESMIDVIELVPAR
ncbi:MAG: DUF4893 domain-containing protein [Sphingomicrobium sp.]|nr:DUF4893 domain-containing protein [Sphingomonadales bacterium]